MPDDDSDRNQTQAVGPVGAKRRATKENAPLDKFAGFDGSTIDAAGTPTGTPPPLELRLAADGYEIGDEIARGGLGRVLHAEDTRLHRPVALKVLHRPHGALRDRFLREAYLTARLQHPAIVPIYEAGRMSDGEPYYAMRLISGRPLHKEIAARKGLDERIALIANVAIAASAMAYAHEQGIVHRDLKPHNIIVGELGETVVIDWGLAKDLRSGEEAGTGGSSGEDSSDMTVTGTVLGTPAYMPPEQGRGEPCDERADIYALGAILYHVLSGSPPYRAESPQEVLAALAAGPPVPLRERERGVPRDLLAIVDKAMARAATDRYASAKQLTTDLQRFAAGQLVGAHRYSFGERVVRFVKKHRAAVVIGAIAVVGGAIGAAWSVSRIVREERVAMARADELSLAGARSEAAKDPERALALIAGLSPGATQWSAARVVAADALAHAPPKVFAGYAPTQSDDTRVRVAVGGGLVAYMGDGKVTVLDPASERRVELAGAWRGIAMDGAARLVAAASAAELVVWDGACLRAKLGGAVASGECVVWRGEAHDDALPVSSTQIAIAHDASFVAWAARSKTVRVVGLADRAVHELAAHTEAVSGLGALPDGALVSASHDGTVRLWDVHAATSRVLPGTTKMVWRLTVSADGARVAAAGLDPDLVMWDLLAEHDVPVRLPIDGDIDGFDFGPAKAAAGARLVYAGFDDKVHEYAIATGERIALAGHEETVQATAFSPDGSLIASASKDSTLRVWDTAKGHGRVFAAHGGGIRWLGWVDGSTVATAGDDGMMRVWDVAAGDERVAIDRLAHYVTDEPHVIAAMSPDGATLAYVGADRALWTRDLAAKRDARVGGAAVTAVAFAADGTLVVGDEAGVVTAGTKQVAKLGGAVTVLAIASSGVVAAGGADGSVAIDGRVEPGVHGKLAVRALAFTRDGKTLASTGRDRILVVWDVAAKTHRTLAELMTGSAFQLGYDAADRLVASAGSEVLVFEPSAVEAASTAPALSRGPDNGQTAARVLVPRSEHGANFGFAIAHESVVVGNDDALIAIDLPTGTRRDLREPDGTLVAVARDATNPDRVVTASNQGVVRLWDLASGESRVLGHHDAAAFGVLIDGAHDRIASVAEDGVMRVYVDDVPADRDALLDRIAAALAARRVVH